MYINVEYHSEHVIDSCMHGDGTFAQVNELTGMHLHDVPIFIHSVGRIRRQGVELLLLMIDIAK